MADLRFITRVPVSDENSVMQGYDAAQERDYKKTTREQATRKSNQDYAKSQQEYDFAAADNPIKLRSAGAAADLAGSKARVGIASEGSDISKAQADAREAGTRADTGAFELGEKQANAPALRQKTAAEGSKAQTEAQAEAEQRQGKLRQVNAAADLAGANARGASTRASKEAYDFSDEQRNGHFIKSLDLLRTQGYEAAAAYAQQNNIPLPPDFLKDARMRAGVAAIEARAKSVYGNQPRAYAEAVAKGIANMKLHADDLGYNPAEEVYSNPAMPQPAEQAFGLQRSAPTPSQIAPGLTPAERGQLALIERGHRSLDGSQLDSAGMAAHLRSLGPTMEKYIPLYDPSFRSPQGTPYHPSSIPFAPQQNRQPLQPQPGQPAPSGGLNFVQPPARPAPPMSQAAPMPGQRTPNTVYMTPKGPLMWTGTGWVAPR